MTASQEKFIPGNTQDSLQQLITTANGIILGKETTIRLALSYMLAQGHLLI
jgi:hypothetical protein